MGEGVLYIERIVYRCNYHTSISGGRGPMIARQCLYTPICVSIILVHDTGLCKDVKYTIILSDLFP